MTICLAECGREMTGAGKGISLINRYEPSKYYNGANQMGRKDFPEKQRELEDNVADVKDGGKPGILAARQIESLAHARDLGIANVTTVQKGQHV